MKILSRKNVCCVCETRTDSVPFKTINGFDLFKCKACKMIYLDQVTIAPIEFLESAKLENSKNQTEYWGYPEYFKKYSKVFDNFFLERFERIVAGHPPKGEWLDIGSGFGLWQSFLKLKSIENMGIEIEPNAFNYSKGIGLNIEHISIEQFSTGKKFAVITICDVLEHVEEPLQILQKCRELLLPDGLIYIQVPNVIGLKIPFGDHLGLPHHLWQFSPRPMLLLGQKSGFQVLNFWTGIQGVIKYYENGGPGFYHNFFWAIAKKMKIGNRLQVLMKK
jgi:SAM-dependent methyltransferase